MVYSIFDIEKLEEILSQNDWSQIHLQTLLKGVCRHQYLDFDSRDHFREIPMRLRSLLLDNGYGITSTLLEVQKTGKDSDSFDGKLVVELENGMLIETVIIDHANYATACVSSQVGCKMGCKFCETGTMGLKGQVSNCLMIDLSLKRFLHMPFWSSSSMSSLWSEIASKT